MLYVIRLKEKLHLLVQAAFLPNPDSTHVLQHPTIQELAGNDEIGIKNISHFKKISVFIQP